MARRRSLVGRAKRRSAGFTLVELLVVIAIIGILIALLLPAVQAAREAARRSQCSNNMKQIGLALHNYADAHKCFPPNLVAAYNVPGTGTYQAYHHTWLTKILPFLEGRAIYDSMDTRLPSWNAAAGVPYPFAQKQVSTLMCPSDSGFTDPSQTWGAAFTAYSANEAYQWWGESSDGGLNGNDGNVASWFPWITSYPEIWGRDFSGVFPNNKTCRLADISDGTSNVLAVLETNSFSFKPATGWNRFGNGGGVPRQSAGEAVFRAAFVGVAWCCNVTNGGAWPDADGTPRHATWIKAGPHMMRPAYWFDYGFNTEWPGASGLHPGMINGLLCDGSVRGLSESLEYVTYVKLNGRRDGMPLPAF